MSTKDHHLLVDFLVKKLAGRPDFTTAIKVWEYGRRREGDKLEWVSRKSGTSDFALIFSEGYEDVLGKMDTRLSHLYAICMEKGNPTRQQKREFVELLEVVIFRFLLMQNSIKMTRDEYDGFQRSFAQIYAVGRVGLMHRELVKVIASHGLKIKLPLDVDGGRYTIINSSYIDDDFTFFDTLGKYTPETGGFLLPIKKGKYLIFGHVPEIKNRTENVSDNTRKDFENKVIDDGKNLLIGREKLPKYFSVKVG